MKIYIRHTEKAYNNNHKGVRYYYDPGITAAGAVLAGQKFNMLLDEYGMPKEIIVSPYVRTRETADILIEIIRKRIECVRQDKEDEEIYMPIVTIEPLVGEYLGNQKHRTMEYLINGLHPDTLNYGPIIGETRDYYHKRVNYSLPDDCWVITHGMFLSTTAKGLGTRINDVESCAALVVDNDGKMVLL